MLSPFCWLCLLYRRRMIATTVREYNRRNGLFSRRREFFPERGKILNAMPDTLPAFLAQRENAAAPDFFAAVSPDCARTINAVTANPEQTVPMVSSFREKHILKFLSSAM